MRADDYLGKQHFPEAEMLKLVDRLDLESSAP